MTLRIDKPRLFIFFLWFTLLWTSPFHAQNLDLKELENEVIGASGMQRMEKGIVYVDALIANGRYDEAQDWAEEIEKLARKLRYPRLRAVALNRAGKAMVLAGKRKAASRLTESNELLEETGVPDRNLTLDNLALLRQLALQNGKIELVKTIDERIEYVRKNNPPPPAPPAPSSTLAAPSTEKPLTHRDFKEGMANMQNKLLSVNNLTMLS